MGDDSLSEFIARYGERGKIILRAILEVARMRSVKEGLGDFSFKDIKTWLARQGIEYNPSLLLSKLEREYGVIETSYRSSSQHWWVIIDRKSIEEALAEEGYYEPASEALGEPMGKVLRAQFYSLEPHYVKSQLKRLARARRLSRRDMRVFREIAFNRLPFIARFLEESSEYPDALEYERLMAEEILELAESVTRKLGSPRVEVYYNALTSKEGEPL